MNGEAKIIRYLIEKGEIKLPLALLREKTFSELENALSSGNPRNVHSCYKKFSDNIDEYIFKIEELFGLLTNAREDLRQKYQEISLSEDDKKIIHFLASNTNLPCEDFFEMSGPIYFICQVLDELDNYKKISDLISIPILMFIYVISYELVLHQVDRRLEHFLKRKREGKASKRFLKIDRKEYMNHASAHQINDVLIEILDISEENKSIFGKSSKPKIIRNKVSHINMFYDQESEAIIIGNEKFTKRDFQNQFYHILAFLLEWIDLSVKEKIANGNAEKFKTVIRNDFKKLFRRMSLLFKKIERSGELKRDFMSLMLKWKKEAEAIN